MYITGGEGGVSHCNPAVTLAWGEYFNFSHRPASNEALSGLRGGAGISLSTLFAYKAPRLIIPHLSTWTGHCFTPRVIFCNYTNICSYRLIILYMPYYEPTMILYTNWATNTAHRTLAYCACINSIWGQSFPHVAYRNSQAHNHAHMIVRICSPHYDSDGMVWGKCDF